MIPLLLLAPLAGVILALLSRAPWQAALGTVVGAAGLLSGAVIQGVSPPSPRGAISCGSTSSDPTSS